MAIENLKKGLIQEAEAEAGKIISAAEKEAEGIRAAGREKEKATLAEARKKADEMGRQQMNDRVSAAKLKAKKMVSEANEALVEKAMEKIWADFKELPSDRNYEGIMKGFISKGQSSMGKDSLVVTNSDDAKIAKKFAANVSQEYADISGGAIIKSKDGKIMVDNSLESIFGSKKQELRRLIYSELLGERKAGKK